MDITYRKWHEDRQILYMAAIHFEQLHLVQYMDVLLSNVILLTREEKTSADCLVPIAYATFNPSITTSYCGMLATNFLNWSSSFGVVRWKMSLPTITFSMMAFFREANSSALNSTRCSFSLQFWQTPLQNLKNQCHRHPR